MVSEVSATLVLTMMRLLRRRRDGFVLLLRA
jgi:hypothetical protein